MIRSTFSGFTIAQMAMSASQRALDVTGQNLSNVNTRGYTRQRLDLASISPVGASMSGSLMDCKVGQGVQMTGISQIRNPFLDLQYRNQLTRVGTVDAKDQILTQIGNIFDETDREGLRTALSNIVSQLDKLASSDTAGSGGADALVRSAMEVFLNVVHEKGGSLNEVESDMISKLEKTLIPDLNNTLQSISKLNTSIKSSQILGSPALELQDERNLLLDKLAEFLPIDFSYEKEDVGAGVMVEKLVVSFTDSAGNKQILVDDNKTGSFKFDTTAGGTPVKLSITDTAGNTIDVTDSLKNGVLKGNLDMLNKSDVFDGSDTKGIGFYEKMFDTFVEEFANTLNGLNVDEAGVEHALFEKIDATKPFSATNIKISDGWMSGVTKIVTSNKPGAGSSAYDNVSKMINALSVDKQNFESNGNTVFKGTFFEMYDNIQNTQAIEKSSTTTILKNQASVLNQVANSRDSVSGVYQDEEVMNLMKFQQSYNAAARLMTTLDEALNTLINNTGLVGR